MRSICTNFAEINEINNNKKIMENKTNKLIAAQYQLFTISDNGERTLVEETTQEQPFVFITGFDAALDALEERLENLKLGEKFDFELRRSRLSASMNRSASSTSTKKCSP